MFETVIASLPAFALFLLAAILLLAGFIALYVRVTPYNELQLIRDGNVAAAISLGGAVLGMALPLAVTVAVSHSLPAMLAWGAVACLVQVVAFVLARLALPQISSSIPQGGVAAGLFLAALSLGLGILNAGCMV